MDLLLIFMSFDIIIGIMKGVYMKNLQSGLMLKGTIKKFVAVLLIISIKLLVYYNYIPEGVYTSTLLFFIIEQFVSIVENYIQMGGKVPDKIKDIFEKGGVDGVKK